ncbi:MAG: hypothetical protein Q9169_006641 [Polycauliona sp. 2 TL-2023]
MLDGFEILTTSGVVLWSKSYAALSSSLINGFIKDVFIEEKIIPSSAAVDDTSAEQHPSYKKEKYTLRWASAKDLGLIFVAVYQSLLHLSWVDKLLDNIRVLFVDLYGDQVRKPHSTIVECNFDDYFDQQVKELEGSAEPPQRTPQIVRNGPDSTQDLDEEFEQPPPPIPGLLPGRTSAALSTDTTPTSTPDTSRPNTPLNGHLLTAKSGRGGTSRRARKAASGKPSPVDGLKEKSVGKAKGKQLRRWDADGMADEDGDVPLDYSVTSDTESRPVSSAGGEPVDMAASGVRTSKGQYILKDLDDEVHSILQNANHKKEQSEPSKPTGVVGSSLGAISGLFRNVIGGKVLTKQDLEKPMKGMEDLLLKKNVAREAAVRLCEGVERELIGKKTGSFESTYPHPLSPFFIPDLTLPNPGIDTLLRASLSTSLTKLLTPTTSLSLLTTISTTNTTQSRPYTISIVGVNGVGKSTSLSKLAFFLLQNNLSLLIAACDTFRSGAVEQLRVHARNLKSLSDREGLAKIELYEKGYGKDAAHIARDAVQYAKENNFNVVLIDTAGRRHNDARLMSSLEKFADLAKPDKILMVGEALVGTDSVMQARAFNAAFGPRRGLDGFLISKCDTVGEMVGVVVSMVHATGIPVVFLGVGQHYGDLRTVNVGGVVGLLMS